VWLNPHITIERALKVIKSVNQIAFLNPLDNLQLNRIVSSIFKYKDDGSLQPILFERKRKIVFKKNSGLNAQEKREIVLELCNKKKADDSMQKLYNIIEQWDFDIYGKISIRKISNNFPISKKTVAKYWSEFKEYVNELNK
jgi:regulator of sigma D